MSALGGFLVSVLVREILGALVALVLLRLLLVIGVAQALDALEVAALLLAKVLLFVVYTLDEPGLEAFSVLVITVDAALSVILELLILESWIRARI